MITFHHSPTAKLSSILRVFYHLGNILPKYNKFRVYIHFGDGSRKLLTCNASGLFSSLEKYDECIIYVFGISDVQSTLIFEQDEFGVRIFD